MEKYLHCLKWRDGNELKGLLALKQTAFTYLPINLLPQTLRVLSSYKRIPFFFPPPDSFINLILTAYAMSAENSHSSLVSLLALKIRYGNTAKPGRLNITPQYVSGTRVVT